MTRRPGRVRAPECVGPECPQISDGQPHFEVQAEAAATLTDLVFVAMSIHLKTIMEIPAIPRSGVHRAVQAGVLHIDGGADSCGFSWLRCCLPLGLFCCSAEIRQGYYLVSGFAFSYLAALVNSWILLVEILNKDLPESEASQITSVWLK